MAVAIPSYAPGAISNYTDVLAEVRDLMDDGAYDQTAIDRALRKAEAWFNRDLRTPEMEVRTVIAVTDELTLLPDDFLELRFVFQEGSPDRPLISTSPQALVSAYRGQPGCPVAYAIEGRSIRVGPVGKTTLDLTYYQRLIPISDAQGTNWLLMRHPDVYIAGVMYYLAVRERDDAGMKLALTQVETLIESIKDATQRNRWGSAPLTPAGIGQVRGARA